MTILYRSGLLINPISPTSCELFSPGGLAVSGQGRVMGAGAWDLLRRAYPGERVLDRSDSILTPGFVDTHLHIPQIDIRGIHSASLIDWLHETVFEAERAHEDVEIAADRARRTFQNLLGSGTTACAAFSTIHEPATQVAFEAAEASGIRAVIGKVLMDREAPAWLTEEPRVAIESAEKIAREWNHRRPERLGFAITPRFAISCSEELLELAGNLRRALNLRVQTHLAENPEELEVVARLFPDAEDYTAVYDQAGLLTQSSLLAHGIHLNDREIDLIHGRGCSVAHCPESNFFLHSGRFQLERFDSQGINVCLGSDVGAGSSFSALSAMKLAQFASRRPIAPERLWWLATVAGARALGWESVTGNFSVGKAADFALLETDFVDLEDAACARPETLSQLIHREEEVTVVETVIEGRTVWAQTARAIRPEPRSENS